MPVATKLRIIARVLDETGAVMQSVQKDEPLQGCPTIALAGIKLDAAGSIVGGRLRVLTALEYLLFRTIAPDSAIDPWTENCVAARLSAAAKDVRRILQSDANLEFIRTRTYPLNTDAGRLQLLQDAIAAGIIQLMPEPPTGAPE